MIDNICSEYEISGDHYGNILIAMTEAVNNAIYHGNKANPEKSIKLSYKARKEQVEFMIEDEGEGFDYQNLPDPTDPNLIDQPKGRGVFLMRLLADEINFFETGNRVELKFKIHEN